MTDEDKKLIFEYIYSDEYALHCNYIHCVRPDIDCVICNKVRELDGNDMVAARNKMVELKKDWVLFYSYAADKWEEEGWDDNAEGYLKNEGDSAFVCRWLMQPARFFDLMANWLKEKKNG